MSSHKLTFELGKIVKVWEHEGSDKLFCEEIDVGEGKPRQIASGLRAYYKLDDLQDRKVLVVCNLKKLNLQVLIRKAWFCVLVQMEKLNSLNLTSGCQDWENVKIDGLTGDPVGPNQMKKRKIWSKGTARFENQCGSCCMLGR